MIDGMKNLVSTEHYPIIFMSSGMYWGVRRNAWKDCRRHSLFNKKRYLFTSNSVKLYQTECIFELEDSNLFVRLVYSRSAFRDNQKCFMDLAFW